MSDQEYPITVPCRPVNAKEVENLVAIANLTLTDDRIAQLVRTLSSYLKNVEHMRQIDVQSAEPPVITYDNCARQ